MEIDEKEYNELRRNQEKLFCLISHGVKDWDEYNTAMNDFYEWLKKDKQKEKINSMVDIYSNKLVELIQKTQPSLGTIINEVGVKEVKDIVEELCIKAFDVIDKDIYEKWANDLMDVIEEIAKEKYPNIPYWLDTGNRYQYCMEMLAHFRKDL